MVNDRDGLVTLLWIAVIVIIILLMGLRRDR